MGYTLTLFPLLEGPRELSETLVYVHTLLEPGQNYTDYAQIDVMNFLDPSVRVGIRTYPIPVQLWVKFNEGENPTRENKCGGEIHFAHAQELKKFILEDSSHWRTKAVMNYIKQLPDNIPIILWF